jgi:hypothetical protein
MHIYQISRRVFMSKMGQWIITQDQNREMKRYGSELTEREEMELAYYEYSFLGYRNGWSPAIGNTLRGDKEAKRGSLSPYL